MFSFAMYVHRAAVTFGFQVSICFDRLCGLVVRVPGYRSRGPGSIPGAARFSEKLCACNGVHSAS
jgi:hypothetical protein